MKKLIVFITNLGFFLTLENQGVLAQIPSFTVTVFDSSLSGYYFLSSKDDPTMMILDKNGSVVYYRTGTTRNSFTLWPNGMMSYASKQKFFFMDSTFTDVDTITTKNLDMPDTHELRVLPNGHFLLIGADLETMDLSQFHWRGQYGSPNEIVQCSVIQEQDADRNVVFEWHAKDYFNFEDADTFFLYHDSPVNWTHSNAIEVDNDGNLLFSTRNFSEITKINRADSSIMWRLGGKHNEFTFVDSPLPFYAQHDIRRASNGNITLFDNGDYIVPHGCRGLEFELDEINKIATQKWSYMYDSSISARSLGNVQRLANSGTLVNFGNAINSDIGFVVIDSSGSKIFQLDGITSYRVFYYPSLPWQLHRPQITSFDSLGVTWLDAGAGYATYLWSNGSTTSKITVTSVADTFHVFVPIGSGGFIRSENFIEDGIPAMPSTITVTGGIGKVCPGETRTYNVTQVNGITYNWTAPTGASINSGQGTNTISVTYGANFTVTGPLSVTGINSYGSSAARILTIKRNDPVAAVTIAGPTTFCSGTNPLTLTANTGTGYSYQWKKGSNNLAGATNQSYIPTTTSNAYKVIVTNTGGCSKTSGGIAVTVNPLPVATITAQGPITFCTGDSVVLQASTGIWLNYQWKKGGANIPGATLTNYTVKAGGVYKVIVTNSNSCSKASAATTVTVNCRLGDNYSKETSLEVSPNPASDIITLKIISNQSQNCELSINDITGRCLLNKKIKATEGVNNYEIDLSSFANGIYLIKLKSGNQQITEKVLKQ